MNKFLVLGALFLVACTQEPEYVKDRSIVRATDSSKYRIVEDIKTEAKHLRYMPQMRMGDVWYDMNDAWVSVEHARAIIDKEKTLVEKGQYKVIDRFPEAKP